LLHLLKDIFGDVVIPPAVARELAQPTRRFLALDASTVPLIRIVVPTNALDVRSLRATLDAGESEAIALASELSADLLMDESAGRAEAKRRGLQTTGAVGVLIAAKRVGLIPSVLPLVDRLRDEIGFFVSQSFRDEVRAQARE
jgi:predicted nucleic acid-binding protein